jgi:hypothetical protein
MAKLVLKYGDAMVEYEGPEGFLKEELPQIVKAVGELRNVAPPIQSHEPVGDIPLALGDAANASVSTIAQKLTINSGPDLLEAAALSFALGGSTTFTKQQIRTCSREAKTFWKKSYGNNFDKYINSLVSTGRLNHVSGDNYALPDKQRSSLQTRLKTAK